MADLLSQAADKALIEHAYLQKEQSSTWQPSIELTQAVERVMHDLDDGLIRVAQPKDGDWVIDDWVKKAILLSFVLWPNQSLGEGGQRFFDKVPLKYADYTASDFQKDGVRVVPGAVVRRGAYVASNVVLMPCFINVGANVGAGSMVDTWATVGSCAQIGARVHIAGGAGIGGVLEPLQAAPTIIESDCFIGARAEIVEGVIVKRGAVIAMGTFIGQSTKILDAATGKITYGVVPEYAVVVPGSLPAKTGQHHVSCAVIIKRVDARTRAKTALNDLLRSE